jgi:REP element-mobilizing transposase RayT
MIDYPPPGFSPLRPDLPVTFYRRHLPHWRQDGATYFVTFRLGDSLPRARLDQLKAQRDAWQRAHPDPSEDDWQAYLRDHMTGIEKWLDQGHGACVLSKAGIADAVREKLHNFDGERYELFAHVVMANHVHAVVRPFEEFTLEDTLKGWKGCSARDVNRALGRKGALWQEETFDRIVRDTPHLRKVVRYIQKNPEKAGGGPTAWVTSAWAQWLDGGGTGRSARPTVR